MNISNQQKLVQTRRLRRQRRVRNRMFGTPERPRLTVFRSSKHIYAQMVNDQTGSTLVSASTLDPEVRKELKYGGNKAAALVVGRVVAERAGHAMHTALVARLLQDRSAWELVHLPVQEEEISIPSLLHPATLSA